MIEDVLTGITWEESYNMFLRIGFFMLFFLWANNNAFRLRKCDGCEKRIWLHGNIVRSISMQYHLECYKRNM